MVRQVLQRQQCADIRRIERQDSIVLVDIVHHTFNVGANLDSADVGNDDVKTRRSTADARGDIALLGVHGDDANLDRFSHLEIAGQRTNQVFTSGISANEKYFMALRLPGFLEWNRTLDIVEKFHEQPFFCDFEDNSMSHHSDFSILEAGDERQIGFN